LAATLHAQNSTAGQSGSAADDALLAKASAMYYSTAKAGLGGFDCAVHPDWLTTFVKANPGQTIGSDDSRVLLLNRVAIALHAHLSDGSATLDWTSPAGVALASDETALLNQMQSATKQTLEGFIQMWTPFVNGEVIPGNTNGLTVTHASTSFTLHSAANGTDVTEVFSNDLLLEHYDLIMIGTSIKFEPMYKATPQGLLVERFLAYIQKAGDPSAPIQEMHVGIEYQTIEGFPIPRQLNIEVVGTGIFNMSLDGCTVSRQ
jgi:hypothetical protein